MRGALSCECHVFIVLDMGCWIHSPCNFDLKYGFCGASTILPNTLPTGTVEFSALLDDSCTIFENILDLFSFEVFKIRRYCRNESCFGCTSHQLFLGRCYWHFLRRIRHSSDKKLSHQTSNSPRPPGRKIPF